MDTETTTLKLVPSDLFNETLKSYQSQLSKTPGVSENATRAIANEAVADWLLRCPLEFIGSVGPGRIEFNLNSAPNSLHEEAVGNCAGLSERLEDCAAPADP